MDVINDYMRQWHASGLYPDKFICHQKHGNQFEIEDAATGQYHNVLTFCTNDVLGLAQHPAVKQAAIASIEQYGTSNSSCSVLSGRIDLHRQLEQEISAFKHLPHTHLFMNAWMALQALVDGFCHLAMPIPGFRHERETLILTDVLNHGCIISAVTNATNRSGKMFSHSPKVRVKAYRHCDMANLAQKLERHAKPGDRIIVISDAVFSMDGDIVPLPEMLDVMEKYPGSLIVMDEAHASGAIGATGGGIYEHFNITPQSVVDRGLVPIIMTTFSKFAGSAGAAISAPNRGLIDLLDICPTSIGTISLPPPVTASALESIRQVRQHPEQVAKLQHNTRYLRSLFAKASFDAIGETNVIPVILPPELEPKSFARGLMEEHKLWVSPIWFVAKPRLRITANALHTEAEMDQLVSGMVAVREKLLSASAVKVMA